MFLPTTQKEMAALGWDEIDIILISGDSYIDSPYVGVALIGKLLAANGYRVGIIAQPDTGSGWAEDIGRLGRPRLFWGVSAGCVDSMVANYTALKKKRRSDDYTPGGVNDRRPDRASIVYANLIRRWCKQAHPGETAAPIVLGGIEASLRRVAHYDFWTDKVRGSLLFDAKADYLMYGMAEKSTLELAERLRAGGDPRGIRGLCYISKEKPVGYVELPALERAARDKGAFIDMFNTFYRNNDPISAKGLCQQHGTRWLVQNPPAIYQTQAELDAVYSLEFERAQHPYYERHGAVKALETIAFSISTHRGCYGECNFCAIAVHEGRTVRWRSPGSILAEAEAIVRHPQFKGYIQDLGGPTANMYGFECAKKLEYGSCPKKRCLDPEVCPLMPVNHGPQLDLLRKVRKMKGVKKVFVASGIRYDLLLNDLRCGNEFLGEVAAHHVSGQMRVAPEHSEEHVLRRMGKPGKDALLEFKERFDRMNRLAGKEQFLTYYLIAAHPGCSEADMRRLKEFAGRSLGVNPEAVQIFTPTPSTYSTLMYYTEMDPETRQPIFIEKDPIRKQRQKDIVTAKRAG